MDSTTVTHVVTGAGIGVLTQLDRFMPPGSVLVLEEPEVCAARDIAGRLSQVACAAGLVEAPVQDTANAGRLAEFVERPEGVRAVLPGLEYGVVAAAALAEAWGLPSAGTAAARLFRDKALLRESVRRLGLAQPDWQRVQSAQEVAAFRDTHGGECVLKPTHLQASVGVQLLGPHDDLEEAWKHTETADEALLRTARDGVPGYLVEERLHGLEFSIEAIVQNGAVIYRNTTETQLYPGRHPVELGHIVPATIPASAPEVVAAMDKVVEATGFRNGVLHAEWILRDGTPHLLECAARIPGGYITLLIGLACEVDLLRGMVDVLGGAEPVVNPGPPPRGAAVRFLDPVAVPGRVREVRGLEEAQATPGVIGVWMAVEPGGLQSAEVTSSWSRPGEVVATGDDRDQAMATAMAAAAAIEIVTDTDTDTDTED